MFSHLDTTNKERFRQGLVDFISSVEYSELITVKDNRPHIRPMVYVNDGLTIYMISRRNTPKIEQIKASPNVSVMIIKSLEVSSDTKEVIIEGRASFVPGETERNRVFEMFKEKPPNFQEWLGKDPNDFEVIKIVPTSIRYFDYSSGDSQPRVLSID